MSVYWYALSSLLCGRKNDPPTRTSCEFHASVGADPPAEGGYPGPLNQWRLLFPARPIHWPETTKGYYKQKSVPSHNGLTARSKLPSCCYIPGDHRDETGLHQPGSPVPAIALTYVQNSGKIQNWVWKSHFFHFL